MMSCWEIEAWLQHSSTIASSGLMGNIWYQGFLPSWGSWWCFSGSARRLSQRRIWPTASCSTKGLYCMRTAVSRDRKPRTAASASATSGCKSFWVMTEKRWTVSSQAKLHEMTTGIIMNSQEVELYRQEVLPGLTHVVPTSLRSGTSQPIC